MKPIYEERSAYHTAPMILCIMAAVLLLCWLGFEIHQAREGRASMLGFGYIVFFAAFLLWKYGFRYTYILTEADFTIVRSGLGIRKVKTIPLDTVDCFAGRYARKPFAHVRTKGYWYSAGDARPTRALVYFVNGKRRAVLFKAGDAFMEHLRAQKPEHYLQL